MEQFLVELINDLSHCNNYSEVLDILEDSLNTVKREVITQAETMELERIKKEPEYAWINISVSTANEMKAMYNAGKKLTCIKLYAELTGNGLKLSKNKMDLYFTGDYHGSKKGV